MTEILQENVDYLRNQSKRRITLNDYLWAYYEAEITPYDPALNPILQQAIERTLTITAEAYENPDHAYYYPTHKRINEYGNHVENVLCQAIEDVTGSSAENLGVGYPDVRTRLGNHWVYPESKICEDIHKVSSMRSFYSTTPAAKTLKIKQLQTGMFLLFKFEHAGPSRLTGRYRVFDLNGLEYTAEGSLQQGNDRDVFKTKQVLART